MPDKRHIESVDEDFMARSREKKRGRQHRHLARAGPHNVIAGDERHLHSREGALNQRSIADFKIGLEKRHSARQLLRATHQPKTFR